MSSSRATAELSHRCSDDGSRKDASDGRSGRPVSPIFVRPVREQLEHDRLIRFLQASTSENSMQPPMSGTSVWRRSRSVRATFFPDLVLTSGKKLAGVVEVETGESVNNLEAMAQWVHFSRARVPFHLYVPVAASTRRGDCARPITCPAEIWTYRPLADGFDLVRSFQDPAAASVAPARPTAEDDRAKPAPSRREAASVDSQARGASPGASTAKPAARARRSRQAARKRASAAKNAARGKPCPSFATPGTNADMKARS